MILSICPNPSIDCTMELEQLNVGQLNRVDKKIITYSGKALNSAIGVSRLGGDSYATGFMYNVDGQLFSQRLDNEGVKNTFIWNEGSVRVNYKIVDNKAMLTEINDIGEEVNLEKQQELLDLVAILSKDASVVNISGSLPKGIENDYYYKLCKAVNGKAKKIIDTESQRLMFAISSGVYMVKPNLKELEHIVSKSLNSYDEMIKSCSVLLDKGAENVLLSLGSDGAILTDGSNSYFCKSEAVAVNSTVGAGDSMVAATCSALEDGCDEHEILLRAVSAGTAAVTTSGTNLFYKDKYDEIYSKIFVEEF